MTEETISCGGKRPTPIATNTWSLHTWESKEAHNQWTRSEAFKAAHSGPRADFIVGHPEFGGYEVRLHSSSMEAKVRV